MFAWIKSHNAEFDANSEEKIILPIVKQLKKGI